MTASYGDPGFEKMPGGYEYSYLPHTFGGPWSQPLSCSRCGAIVIGKNTDLHNKSHGGSVSDVAVAPVTGLSSPSHEQPV